MIKLFINGWAASAGGGLTYLRNVVPHISQRGDVEATVLVSPALRRDLDDFPRIFFVDPPPSSGVFSRFVQEQRLLPILIRNSGAHVLISAGNFALLRSPVPQILLSRNSLYTSADFIRDLKSRRAYAILADTHVKAFFARTSIRAADLTIAPSEAFAAELTRWSGRNVIALYHGFDAAQFMSDPSPLPRHVQAQLGEGDDALRLLFVSHYNYYRNFETLFRAIPLLKNRLPGTRVKLYLTCQLDSRANPGAYRAEAAASLLASMLAAGDVVELGTVPYASLHHLYRACHIYVTPAYAESFAHPLVEAMSCGLPIVASDIPVHREICGDSALYFDRFSPEAIAERILEIQASQQLAETLSAASLKRSRDFSWERHVERLVEIAESLVAAV